MQQSIIIGVFTLLCWSQIGYSQIFVPEIEEIEKVVLDFCLNESSERINVSVNEQKSTYKNTAIQKSCQALFKNSKIVYPEIMLGTCSQSTYYFFNTKYQTNELNAQDKKRCKAFHNGKFLYVTPDYSSTLIIRNNTEQLEINPNDDDAQQYKVEWLADHIYTLETIKLPTGRNHHQIGDVIHVEIIGIVNATTYLYKSHVIGEESNDLIFGVIEKVKSL